jgi:hypothetical protein
VRFTNDIVICIEGIGHIEMRACVDAEKRVGFIIKLCMFHS